MSEGCAHEWIDCERWDPLARDEVRIIRFDLRQPRTRLAALADVLSSAERTQADRFARVDDRRRFIARRGLLRLVLGQAVGRDPAVLQIRTNAFGKPFLSGSLDGSPIRFNLSHSGDTALCALASGREVGVDVETVDPDLDPAGLVAQTLTPREIHALLSLEPGERVEAFFACWTRKEAYLKARGVGFHVSPTTCAVSVDPRDPAPVLDDLTCAGEEPAWTLRSLAAGEGFAAAVAVEGGGWRLRRLRWCA